MIQKNLNGANKRRLENHVPGLSRNARSLLSYFKKTLCASTQELYFATKIPLGEITEYLEEAGAVQIWGSGRWALPPHFHTRAQNALVRTLRILCDGHGGIDLDELSQSLLRTSRVRPVPTSILSVYLREIYDVTLVGNIVTSLPQEHTEPIHPNQHLLMRILDENNGYAMTHRIKRALALGGATASFIQCEMSELGFAKALGDNLYGYVHAKPDMEMRSLAIKAFNEESSLTPSWAKNGSVVSVELTLGVDYWAGKIVSLPNKYQPHIVGMWKTPEGASLRIDQRGIRTIMNIMKNIHDTRSIRLALCSDTHTVTITEIEETKKVHQFVRTPSEVGKRLRQSILQSTVQPISSKDLRQSILKTFENSLIAKDHNIEKHYDKHLDKLIEKNMIYRITWNNQVYIQKT